MAGWEASPCLLWGLGRHHCLVPPVRMTMSSQALVPGRTPGCFHTLTLAPLSPGNPGPVSSTATYKHKVIWERCICHRGMEVCPRSQDPRGLWVQRHHVEFLGSTLMVSS